jgi:hypothetical protein
MSPPFVLEARDLKTKITTIFETKITTIFEPNISNCGVEPHDAQ